MEEKSLQATVDKFYKKIPAGARLATGATFLMGILVNLFVFTNKSVNHDDIMAEFIFNKQLDIVSGRYMWLIIRRITSYYDMPMFFGIIGMLALALSAGMTVHLLGVKDKLFVLLISGIMASFPINACYYSYLSISPIYYFAIITAVLGVFLVDRCGKYAGIFPAGMCIMMSLATYQSFLALTIGLVFIMAFLDLFRNDFKIGKWFFKYFRYAVAAVLGFVFYFVGTKISLAVTGEQLRQYAGTDKMFSLEFMEILKSFKTTWENQKEFYFTTQAVSSRGFVWINRIVLAAILVIIIVQLVRLIRDKKYVQAAVTVAMTAASPFFLNFIYIMMNGKSSVHMLMKYALILPYFLIIALVCATDWRMLVRKFNVKYVLQWATALCAVGIIYYGALTSNQLYLRMYYNTQAIDSFCTQLLAQLSMQENFSTDEPVYFANFTTFFNENYVTTATFTQDLHPYVWMGTDIYLDWYSSNHLIRYMDFNHHIRLIASNNKSREDEVKATEEFKNMPCYPDGGSIKTINGLLTVKFAN
ncbi:MAG: glucosyltransferase domain-containing protein [Lachnospira sp.]|nr:glucosyltransferase domain-containing protein [Lachnospira sp.]